MGRCKKLPREVKGRTPPYAYFVQAYREGLRRREPDKPIIFSLFVKKCAQLWKNATAEQKKPFLKLSDDDKQRYKKEMGDRAQAITGKKARRQKDPNAPKRSLTAFFWFSYEERWKVQTLFPEYKLGDVSKELGRRWTYLDPLSRKRYNILAQKDRERYQKEMMMYNYQKANSAMQQTACEEEELGITFGEQDTIERKKSF